MKIKKKEGQFDEKKSILITAIIDKSADLSFFFYVLNAKTVWVLDWRYTLEKTNKKRISYMRDRNIVAGCEKAVEKKMKNVSQLNHVIASRYRSWKKKKNYFSSSRRITLHGRKI